MTTWQRLGRMGAVVCLAGICAAGPALAQRPQGETGRRPPAELSRSPDWHAPDWRAPDWHPPPPRLGEAPNVPLRVITDTPEYCAHLARLYALLRRGTPEVPQTVETQTVETQTDLAARDMMAHDGAALCDRGDVRMGVHALRRALVGFGSVP